MNSLKYVFFFICLGLFVACGGEEQNSARQAPVSTQTAPTAPATTAPAATTTPATATTPTTPPPPAEPPQNADGVWHYTCSNGCEGGAGSATACAKCGNTLAHNTAYHGTPPATPNAAADGGAAGAIQATGGTPPTMFADPSKQPVNATIGTQAAPVQAAEPPQNAAGVWHYTCSNGCAGGGGSATACAKCGNTLAHNQAYHQ